ncbi:MAG: hypothetical protein GVY33_06255 [Alphaproteobacteria bacterium]|nr:hypothetical protein [Alphaproteobacteria bacterium]
MVEEAAAVDDRRCRLLVRLRDTPSATLGDALAALRAADRLAGLIAPPTPGVGELAGRLGVALLAADGDAGADGAVLDARDTTVDVVLDRRRGDPEAILVADVATSRHAAMEAGEAGADALLFTGEAAAVRDCVAWWSELFVLPVAAPAAYGCSYEELIRAGADFLVVDADALGEGAEPVARLLDRLTAAEAARPDTPA